MASETLLYYLAFVPTIIVAITAHEFAHARLALAFGDTTARDQGRVTLNPLAHLDPIGTLGIIFAGFGWGRPVPVDARRLRHPRADLLVSAAGPGMNIILAAAMGVPLRFPVVIGWLQAAGMLEGALILATVFVQTNLMLAFFNFIPLYPLDGSHMLHNLLPQKIGAAFSQFNHAYGNRILLVVILISYVTPFSPIALLIGPPIDFMSALIFGA